MKPCKCVNLLQISHASVNRNYCNCKQAMLMKKETIYSTANKPCLCQKKLIYCKQAMLMKKRNSYAEKLV